MASKDEVLAKLNEHHSGTLKKISPKALALIAEKIAAKNPEQSIEELYEALENSPISIEDLVTTMKSEADRRVREAQAPPKQDEPKQAAKVDEPVTVNPSEDKITAMFAKFEQLAEQMSAKIGGYEKANKQSALNEKLKAAGIPEKLARHIDVNAEGYDESAVIDELKNDWAELSQSRIDSTLGDGKLAGGSGPIKDNEVSGDMKAYLAAKSPTPEVVK